MITKLRKRWMISVAVCLGFTAFVAALSLPSRSGSTGPTQQVPPPELIKPPLLGTGGKAVYNDLFRSWYDWDGYGKRVQVIRREREDEDVGSTWAEQRQGLFTAFYIIDVRHVCGPNHQIERLFVAGIYPNGDSCVEVWQFIYPHPSGAQQPGGGGSGGGYVPLDQRDLPSMDRRELFRSSNLGFIKSLEPDPDGRFVLFLTQEPRTLYRLHLPGGGVNIELDQSAEPHLGHIQQVIIEHHISEGRMVHLSPDLRWHASTDPGDPDSLLLVDSENDGVFESRLRLTHAEWEAAGYSDWTMFVNFCP